MATIEIFEAIEELDAWEFVNSSRSTKGTRFRSVSDFAEITKTTPEKSLLEPLKKSGGRDNHGHISMRRRGGGHKRMYRVIDFKRNKFGIAGHGRGDRVRSEPLGAHRAGPVRGRREALHPAPAGLAVGDAVIAGPGADIRLGNALPLAEIPLGTTVHNVELKIGKGGQMARSAGHAGVQVVAKEGEYVTLACRAAKCGWCTASAWRRSARSATPSTSCMSVGQGRQDALEGSASEGARRGHEPGRPPAAAVSKYARRTERRSARGARRKA